MKRAVLGEFGVRKKGHEDVNEGKEMKSFDVCRVPSSGKDTYRRREERGENRERGHR